MSKKTLPPLTIAPLQRVRGEVITDPAEQALIDRARKRARRVRSGDTSRNGMKKAKKGDADQY